MNNKWLISFMTVAQEGSVTAASKTLFISPQALLQQINLLEDEVGTKLFNRTRNGMTLTLAGQEFLGGSQQIETVYATTLSRCRLASKAENKIRIPMMSSIILPKFMEEVCSTFNSRTKSGLKGEFISDETFGSWLDGLKNLKYDIIEHFTIDGICPEGIHFEYLNPVQSWCIMSVFHPLADKKSIRPEDLDGYKIAMPEDNLKLMRYLQMYIDGAGINVSFENIENDRYKTIEALNSGEIYMADSDIAKLFVGYSCLPLRFDTHIQHGFACRKDMYETYRPFFDIAHVIADSNN